jgi:hypothetical protein
MRATPCLDSDPLAAAPVRASFTVKIHISSLPSHTMSFSLNLRLMAVEPAFRITSTSVSSSVMA